MTRTQIRLDTLSEVNNFVDTMSQLPDQVWLEDGGHIRVSAKSMLACLYSLEWTRIFVYCERDISSHLLPWTV